VESTSVITYMNQPCNDLALKDGLYTKSGK